MKAYIEIVKRVIDAPIHAWKKNRTGVPTKSIVGAMFQHDMNDGFPLLTTKKMPFGVIAVELEGFLKGITDKRWYQDRGCHIWNQWSNPTILPDYSSDEERKSLMLQYDDLGPIYGYQWRYQGKRYIPKPELEKTLVPNVYNVAYGWNGNLSDIQKKLKSTWYSMIRRCYSPKDKDYSHYGGQGVYVVNDWLNFSNFANDVQFLPNWERKVKDWNKYSLDKDSLGLYYYGPDSCVWADSKTQSRHRVNIHPFMAISPDGKRYIYHIIKDAADELGLDNTMISDVLNGNYRHHRGWQFIRLPYRKRGDNGVDQLVDLIEKLKHDPFSRRLLVSAWNVAELDQMALPPCHFAWQMIVSGDERLNLIWYQRSVDVALGLPFNIASYGLLLTLLAKEVGREPGILTGMLADVHIYANHYLGLDLQVHRDPLPLPRLNIPKFVDIFSWQHRQLSLSNYTFYPPIKYEIAV